MAKTKGKNVKSHWARNFQTDIEKLLEVISNANFSDPGDTRQAVAQAYYCLLSLRGKLSAKIDVLD